MARLRPLPRGGCAVVRARAIVAFTSCVSPASTDLPLCARVGAPERALRAASKVANVTRVVMTSRR